MTCVTNCDATDCLQIATIHIKSDLFLSACMHAHALIIKAERNNLQGHMQITRYTKEDIWELATSTLTAIAPLLQRFSLSYMLVWPRPCCASSRTEVRHQTQNIQHFK